MGVARFLLDRFREAPSKTRLLRSLALGARGGDRAVESPDGTTLSARRSGDGPPVVMVHGALDGIGSFALVELHLADRFGVWVYDRRGRGGSGDGADYSLEREVDDLRAVAAATGETPHVVGHSYGAVIALAAALDGMAMRSLVVYEPPINPGPVTDEVIERIERLVAEDRLDDAITMMAGDLAGVTDEELAPALRVPPIRATLRAGVRVVARELRVIQSCDWAGLPVTGVPTLVIDGERRGSDAYPDADQRSGLATDVELATLAGQGHLANTYAPVEFARVVGDFLARH